MLFRSGLNGLPPTRVTSTNQEGTRNRNTQSTPQASAPSHATHNLSQVTFGGAETTGFGDISQQAFCNPSSENDEEDAVEEDSMDEDTVDEDIVEELTGVASPVGHPNN